MIPLQCDEYNLPRCCTRPASFCFRFKCKQKLLNPKIIFVAKRIAIHEMLLKIVLFASSSLHSIFYRLSFFRLFSQIFFEFFLLHNFSITRFVVGSAKSAISKSDGSQLEFFLFLQRLRKVLDEKILLHRLFLLKIFFGFLIHNFLTFDFIRYTEKCSHSRFAKLKFLQLIDLFV